MEKTEVICKMSNVLNLSFWDFRCNFMHHPSSIPFDLSFFKVAKNNVIIFGTGNDSIGLYSFADRELNKHLSYDTLHEWAIKHTILSFFFLRKQLAKAKKGVDEPEDVPDLVELLFEVGESYGYLKSLEGIKRHIETSMQSKKMHNVYSVKFGGMMETALRTASRFRPNKKTPKRDALCKVLEKVVGDYTANEKKYPSAAQVISILADLALGGNKTIQEVDYEDELVYWQRAGGTDAGPTTFKQIRERLTGVRKKIRKS